MQEGSPSCLLGNDADKEEILSSPYPLSSMAVRRAGIRDMKRWELVMSLTS